MKAKRKIITFLLILIIVISYSISFGENDEDLPTIRSCDDLNSYEIQVVK